MKKRYIGFILAAMMTAQPLAAQGLSLIHIYSYTKTVRTGASSMEMTDIHAHILPGIDDGPETMEETRRMLRKAFEQGIRSIIATPHYFRRHYEPEVRQIYELVSAVQAEADTLTPGLRIYPGQEIMHFYEIEEFLLEKKVIPLSGTRYVLIEFLPSVVYKMCIRDSRDPDQLPYGCASETGGIRAGRYEAIYSSYIRV